MGQAIPRQHPAVVLRSHYRQLRALLAIAMVAVLGLSVAVVILATDDETTTTASSVRPIEPIAYGGFNPQTGAPQTVSPQSGSPATSGFRTSYQPVHPSVQTTRPSGGPEESGVAAAIAPKPNVATPDESKIAAAIARSEQAAAQSRPDESGVAAFIAGH